MPLSYEIEDGIVFIRASGELLPGEQARFIESWMSDPDLPSPILVCREHTGPGSESAFPSPESARAQAALVRTLDGGPDARLALVASEDLAYGMANIFRAWIESAKFETEIFATREEAVAWLRS
jgi:hypothetical protein